MKRKIMIIILLVIMILTSIMVYLINNFKYKNIYYATAFDESYLKDLNITFEPTQIIPKVSKNKIRNIAINMLKKSYPKPKGVYIEYGLITDKNRSINVFPKDIIEANPTLKERTYINQIPVWLITFKGLLPDDYKNTYDSQNGDISGKQPLDSTTTVIDAMSGKMLYGFGSGKRSK